MSKKYILTIPDEQNITEVIELLNNLKDCNIEALPDPEKDWWDELPQSVKDDHEAGLKEIEEGKLIEVDEFLKKYRRKP